MSISTNTQPTPQYEKFTVEMWSGGNCDKLEGRQDPAARNCQRSTGMPMKAV